MKLETFFGKFDRFVDTPGAVSKMRELIRHMAVQGKLVPQDRNDELAEDLLKRLETDRCRLAIEQGVRLPKSVPPVTEDNYPHIVPQSWRWARIGSLGLLIDYGTSQKANSDSAKVPMYRMGNIVAGRLIDVNLKFVDEGIDDLPALYLKTNDILFNRTNSYELVGKSGIYTGPDDVATFASYLIRIRFPATLLFSPFFNVAMNAPYFRQSQIEPEVVQQCGQANFNGTKLASTIVPIPPLAEQKRIVAKVDELMALCDRLEAQQQERETRHSELAGASLARFADAPTPANLQFLFHPSYAISPADLRKSILTLALRGNLSAKARAVEWTPVLMRDVCLQITDGEHATPQRTATGVPLATAKNVRDGFLDLTSTDYVAHSTAEKCWRRCKPRDQDVLMVCVGATTGRVCLVSEPPDMVLVRSVALIRPNTGRIAPSFLDLFLRSPVGQSQIWSNVRQSAQPCLYLGKMAEFEIELPPLAEQHRIIAKVDQLMTLVDELETLLEASRGQAEKLMEAVMAELTAGDWTLASSLGVSTTGMVSQ